MNSTISGKIFKRNDIESFYFAILYGSYFKLKSEVAEFTDDLQEVLGTIFLEQLEQKRPDLCLDLNLNMFEKQ